MSLSLSEIVTKIASQGNNPDISFLKDNPEAQALLLSAIVSHVKTPVVDDKRKYDQIEQQQEQTKKPGRKPVSDNEKQLNDEDTQTKRKAQNRAAQRAFRERKENEVRHLEDKLKALESGSSGKNEALVLENENLRDMILRLQNENAALLGSTVSFDYPLSYDDDMRPQKIIRQNVDTSPTSTHLDSLSSGYSVSSKSRSNTPELTVDKILGNIGLPSDALLDHSELFTQLDYNSSQLQDILQQPNFQLETDPSQFDFFYPLKDNNNNSSQPSNSITQASNLNTTSSTLASSTDKTQASSDNVGELSDMTQVWDKLSEHPNFGEIDIDDLCDRMKKKAVCNDFNHDKELEQYFKEQFPQED